MPGGWIYVLVNSAMPGLVKVGKTTRDPRDRAQELSGVSGVPTPFIVAFQHYVTDCDAAEAAVHTALARKGYREAVNREFFRADATEAIKAVLELPPAAPNEREAYEQGDSPTVPSPWDDLIMQGDQAHLGYGDALQDYQRALMLYQDALRMGSLEACERIGRMHELGDGVRKDVNEAIRYYRQGAERGNYYCYARLAFIFDGHVEGFSHLEDATKCWSLFFRSRAEKLVDELEASRNSFLAEIYNYTFGLVLHGKLPSPEIAAIIKLDVDDALDYVEQRNERYRAKGGPRDLPGYRAVKHLLSAL